LKNYILRFQYLFHRSFPIRRLAFITCWYELLHRFSTVLTLYKTLSYIIYFRHSSLGRKTEMEKRWHLEKLS